MDKGKQPKRSSSSSSGSRSRSKKSKANVGRVFCHAKFQNTLPEIPFDGKIVQYNFDSLRYLLYKTINAERTVGHRVTASPLETIAVDSIDPQTYVRQPGARLDDEDMPILEEESTMQGSGTGSAGRRTIAPIAGEKIDTGMGSSVTWLTANRYLSHDVRSVGKVLGADASESKFGTRALSKVRDLRPLSFDEQLALINDSFEAVRSGVPQKGNLGIVEEMDVMLQFDPEVELVQAMFDQKMEYDRSTGLDDSSAVNCCVLKGETSEPTEVFYRLYLPISGTEGQRIVRERQDTLQGVVPEEHLYAGSRSYEIRALYEKDDIEFVMPGMSILEVAERAQEAQQQKAAAEISGSVTESARKKRRRESVGEQSERERQRVVRAARKHPRTVLIVLPDGEAPRGTPVQVHALRMSERKQVTVEAEEEEEDNVDVRYVNVVRFARSHRTHASGADETRAFVFEGTGIDGSNGSHQQQQQKKKRMRLETHSEENNDEGGAMNETQAADWDNDNDDEDDAPTGSLAELVEGGPTTTTTTTTTTTATAAEATAVAPPSPRSPVDEDVL